MNEQNIFEDSSITSNSEQFEILKNNFPNCFDNEGNFILDSFKEIIKDNDLDFSKESYSLNWLGKSYAQLLRNEKIHTFIQPNHKHNNKTLNKNSHNLLIKGDNLEILKHLRNAYHEKIKMIYIDPPYNTGFDDFIYQDNRKFTVKELMHLAKISENEANRILNFTSKGSNSHSAWLTFIYPRLYIARELLRQDGVIFISIDDNQQAQLKLLCDEIFGEENFIVNFIWQKKRGGGNDSIHVALEHEYVIMFAKNKEALNALFQTYSPTYLERYNQEDHISKYYWDTFKRKSGKQYYPITCPDGSILQHDEFGNEISWLRSEARFYSDLKCGDVKLEKTKNNDWNVYFKQRLPKGKKPRSILIEKSFLNDSGSTSDGSDDLFKLFQVHVFNNPKPVKLLKNLLEIITTENDIILDFFAGSGTTAQAIMDLNAEDNADRQFILAQLPEPLDPKKTGDKVAYNFCIQAKIKPNIFSITKARIEKSAEKIQQKEPKYSGDLGFKIFKTLPFPVNYGQEILKLTDDPQQVLFSGVKDNTDLLDAILTTWTLYDRIPLTTSLKEFLIDNYKAQYSDEYNTLYLIHPNFTTQNIKTLIDIIEIDPNFIPEKIVIYGFNFDSKSQRELDEALRGYQNKKSLKIDLLIRYY